MVVVNRRLHSLRIGPTGVNECNGDFSPTSGFLATLPLPRSVSRSLFAAFYSPALVEHNTLQDSPLGVKLDEFRLGVDFRAFFGLSP
jgi:hypothetical protein